MGWRFHLFHYFLTFCRLVNWWKNNWAQCFDSLLKSMCIFVMCVVMTVKTKLSIEQADAGRFGVKCLAQRRLWLPQIHLDFLCLCSWNRPTSLSVTEAAFQTWKRLHLAYRYCCCYLRLIDSKYRTTLACMNYGFPSREKTSSGYWSASEALVRGQPGWRPGLPSSTFL